MLPDILVDTSGSIMGIRKEIARHVKVACIVETLALCSKDVGLWNRWNRTCRCESADDERLQRPRNRRREALVDQSKRTLLAVRDEIGTDRGIVGGEAKRVARHRERLSRGFERSCEQGEGTRDTGERAAEVELRGGIVQHSAEREKGIGGRSEKSPGTHQSIRIDASATALSVSRSRARFSQGLRQGLRLQADHAQRQERGVHPGGRCRRARRTPRRSISSSSSRSSSSSSSGSVASSSESSQTSGIATNSGSGDDSMAEISPFPNKSPGYYVPITSKKPDGGPRSGKKDSGLESGDASDASEEPASILPCAERQQQPRNFEATILANESPQAKTIFGRNGNGEVAAIVGAAGKTLPKVTEPVYQTKIRSALAKSILRLRKGVITKTKSLENGRKVKQMVSVLKKPPRVAQTSVLPSKPNESIVTMKNSSNDEVQNIIVQETTTTTTIATTTTTSASQGIEESAVPKSLSDEAKKPPRREFNLAEYLSRREQTRSDNSRTC